MNPGCTYSYPTVGHLILDCNQVTSRWLPSHLIFSTPVENGSLLSQDALTKSSIAPQRTTQVPTAAIK